VLRRVKDLDASVALLKLALVREPDARSIRLQLAETLYEKGAYEEAERQFQALLQANQEQGLQGKRIIR
jgi:predicted Zn-dependent protease